nr:hypothetical protein TEA_018319 [Ipomoea trifida]
MEVGMEVHHLGPDSSSGRIFEVESAMIHSVLGLWWWVWMRSARKVSSFCHSSHFSARPSPSSIRTTSDILGRSNGEFCVQRSATWISCSTSSSTNERLLTQSRSMTSSSLARRARSKALCPVMISRSITPYPNTSVFSEDLPVERYSGAMCPIVPRTAKQRIFGNEKKYLLSVMQRFHLPCTGKQATALSVSCKSQRAISQTPFVNLTKSTSSKDIAVAEIVRCDLQFAQREFLKLSKMNFRRWFSQNGKITADPRELSETNEHIRLQKLGGLQETVGSRKKNDFNEPEEEEGVGENGGGGETGGARNPELF